MEKLYTVSKKGPEADCGSDHELLIAKFKLKLKKVGKTTIPFRYDLNQITYDYTVAEKALQIAVKRREVKNKGEKERIKYLLFNKY